MGFTVLQNTPTVIDLAGFARTTGWTIGDGYADHETCNAGFLTVNNSAFTPVTGSLYTISYKVSNYGSGLLRLDVGTAQSANRTANGNYTDTLTATGSNPKIRFYSNGALRLEIIDIKLATPNVTVKKRNTFVYSEENNKWTSFYSFTSDFGLSLFKDLFTFKAGRFYKHDPNLNPRNNIYGVQYNTIFKFVANGGLTQPKTFLALSYEANELMVTTAQGIKSSLGQISELISEDFLKTTLDDGVTQIDIYNNEGIFSSSFLRDMSNGGDLINGDVLKGTWITIELIQVNNQILTLKNISVHSEPSKIGSR